MFNISIKFDIIMLCRYSLVEKQVLGKDQQTVQFCLSAPFRFNRTMQNSSFFIYNILMNNIDLKKC